MINQKQQQQNKFNDDEIQLIRTYLGKLQINQKDNQISVSQIAIKIHNEKLQTKSIIQIQNLIKQILYSSTLQKQQLNNINKPEVEMEIQLKYQYEHNNENNLLLTPKTTKQSHQIKIQNDQAPLISKSLFKSFNTPLIVKQTNSQIPHNYSNKLLNLIETRKFNIFTKPQAIRKNSNGFITVNQNNNKQIKQFSSEYQNQLPSFGKKNTKQYKQTFQQSSYQIRSPRKIKPRPDFIIDPSLLTSQQKIGWIQNNTHDCHSIIQKKINKKNAGQSKQTAYYVNQNICWLYNQYFYGNYDKFYFNQDNSQLNKLYRQFNIDPNRISFKQRKTLLTLLPKPKLFNIDFLITQQNKLNQFRTNLRQLPKDKSKFEDIQLSVGRQVVALHPICGHLHSGTILAIYKQNQYMVKFLRPELGTQKVLDINISSRSLLSSNNKAAIQNIDYQAMVIVIKLLQYKGDLIERFKQYNCIIQQANKQSKQIDNSLLQQYGWLGSTINILSMGLRHIMAKFRIRGINNTNQQIVGKHFSSLLINPLNLMSKQLQNSSQVSDIQTSKQIKKLTQNRSSNRIQSSMLILSDKFSHYLQQNSVMNPQKKQIMDKLLQNFIAILLNLRYQGRNFNIQSNKYLNNIIQMIDSQYAQYFNEIYINLHSIIKKINSQQKQD